MGVQTVQLDPAALAAAVDRCRQKRGVSAREVLRQIDWPSPSALHKLSRGRQPSADLLVRLLLWLGDTDLRPYLVKREVSRDG